MQNPNVSLVRTVMGRSIGAALLVAASGTALAGGGDVVGLIGNRSLSDDLWRDADNQVALGVLADFRLGQTPLYLAAGIVVSGDDGGDNGSDAAVADLSAGLKVMRTEGGFRPYAGLGVASVGATIDTSFFSSDDEDDQSYGYYLNGGALFRVNPHFTVGVDLRYIGATHLTLLATRGDADSFTGSLLIGFSWGD